MTNHLKTRVVWWKIEIRLRSYIAALDWISYARSISETSTGNFGLQYLMVRTRTPELTLDQ